MSREIVFTKISGTGNDFVVVDNRDGKISARAALAKKWCDRKHSIGGDGLLLLEKSKKADFRMRILNTDGSEAEMCGNGIRCIAKFAHDKKIAGSRMTIETIAGLIDADVKGDMIKARMIEPRDMKLGFDIPLGGKSETVNFVNTGVPHVVRIVRSLEKIDVGQAGREIRTHRHFSPRGTNANFIQFEGGNSIRIRTYERGVEDETLACGTGSTAGALVAAAVKNLKSPVSVTTEGGGKLKIYFSKDGDRFHDVYLEGAVEKCFEWRVTL